MLPLSADRGRLLAVLLLCFLLTAEARSGGEELPMRASNSKSYSVQCVTNVSQFRNLSNMDYIIGCNFHLTGVVTLVDTNRELVVLQDATGAVALNFRCGCSNLEVGQSVTLDGTNACPLFSSFPDYPFRPAGREICSSFETPSDWGEYNLTRMRGYLHPRVSGNYRFWIASDNSSELWLSTDANPWNARRIAFIPRFGWTAAHQWTVFTSQHSDVIQLNAGETYYVEALQEQTAEAENLSVGWQEPSSGESAISVIGGGYLTPWRDNSETGLDIDGILREYWTNYPAGDVAGMAGTRPFESALTVETISLHIHGKGQLPKPDNLALNRPWSAEDNYRWVSVEGMVRFQGRDGDVSQLEVFTGRNLVEVRALCWNGSLSKQIQTLTNAFVKVEGVCEGIHDSTGAMTPGLIWASTENSISVIGGVMTNNVLEDNNGLISTAATNNPVSQDYFQTQGIVTFNDRVFDKDLIFIQGDKSVTKVTLQNSFLKKQLTVGRNVEVGGALGPGKYIQSISPFFVADMGQQVMPLPIAYPPDVPVQANLEGRWSEIEGVVHSVNTNDTLTVESKNGVGYLWLGQAASNYLAGCVDAKLRARGVLVLAVFDAPLLLIPSRNFVDVEEAAPDDPFIRTRRWPIAKLLAETFEPWRSHRVCVVGEVTYRDAGSLFVQDTTGGIRVQTVHNPTVIVGDRVEVAAFPSTANSDHELTEAVVRAATQAEDFAPKNLELNDISQNQQSGILVQVSATFLGRKTNGVDQMLEMQERQHIFTATLLTDLGNLPEIVPGSRLRVTGIRQDQTIASSTTSDRPVKMELLSSLNILLRNPKDVEVLSGPPWWSWKKTATLGGLLLITLVVALFWTHLLRRRLERQQAEQLAFSQHVLGKLEEERRRIAGDLHDSLGQMLMVIKHRVISATESLKEKPGIQKSMDEISTVTSQALEEVRRISHGLGPHQLDHLGLTRAIRASIDRASENSSIVFASRVENIDGLFEREAEILLYRIVQEAVTNILKHSAATEAAVVVKKHATAVSISIRDNGKGFDPARPSTQMDDFGYGLSGIAERARILKGTFMVESQPGAGTSLTTEIPFNCLGKS